MKSVSRWVGSGKDSAFLNFEADFLQGFCNSTVHCVTRFNPKMPYGGWSVEAFFEVMQQFLCRVDAEHRS